MISLAFMKDQLQNQIVFGAALLLPKAMTGIAIGCSDVCFLQRSSSISTNTLIRLLSQSPLRPTEASDHDASDHDTSDPARNNS